jgi:hypothetical protein
MFVWPWRLRLVGWSLIGRYNDDFGYRLRLSRKNQVVDFIYTTIKISTNDECIDFPSPLKDWVG